MIVTRNLLLLSVMGLFGYYVGDLVPSKDQISLYGAFRNTSAILFAVLGAWIALLFPGSAAQLFLQKRSRASAAQINIEKDSVLSDMLDLMGYSTIILVATLVVTFSYPIIKNFAFILVHAKIIKMFSFGVLTGLFMLQLYVLYLTLIPAFNLKFINDRGLKKEAKLRKYEEAEKELWG